MANKLSQYYAPTLKEAPKDADILSAKLMLRAGLIRKTASGIYEWLPLGMRVFRKVENIVREELDKIGAQEIILPAVQPKELWEQTGRWEEYGKELLRFEDRKKAGFCFSPTAEEVITNCIKRAVKSYKQLPVVLYQFCIKFRDEIRPRFGVMRSREFYMKDAYSFCETEKSAEEWYKKFFEAYNSIFTRCGLKFKAVEAESGNIGGSFSHEFMVVAKTGENAIEECVECGYLASDEKAGKKCPKCGGKYKSTRGIEVGHTFKLGTKYSESMNAKFLDKDQKPHPFIMGCYGIGITRVVAAAIEQNNDENGIIWTKELSPFDIHLITISEDEKVLAQANLLIKEAEAKGLTVLWDDRDKQAGMKFKEADLLGLYNRIVISPKTLKEDSLEYKARDSKDATMWKLSNVKTKLNDLT